MNKFLNSFVFPSFVFLAVIFGAYTAVLYCYKHIKSDPINQKYITMQQRDAELNCLARNVAEEAGGENAEGKVAVAQVTLNRVRSGKFGDSICSVVYSHAQFSWTLTKPKSLPFKDKAVYNESVIVAKKVLLEGYTLPSLTKATYYHNFTVNPSWNKNMRKVAVIGHHIFYEG